MLNKKIVIIFSLLLFLANSSVAAAPAMETKKPAEPEALAKIEPKVADKRAKILQAYLAKYDSPLQNNAADFVEAADTFKLDWKLLPAIAGVESTFGKFTPGNDYYPSYNAWGWGVYGNQALYFRSWREAIFTIAAGLRENYFNKGLDNPYVINHIYSESPTWGWKVDYFTQDLRRFEVENSPIGPAAPVISTNLSKELPKALVLEGYPFVKLPTPSAKLALR